MAQQNGASWFGISGDSWKVSMNDAATTKVGAYWQGLIDNKSTEVAAGYAPEWFNDLQSGKIASYAGPVWFASILKSSAANSSGKWAVAPMPSFDASKPATGTIGGSATSVLTGCKHVQQAVDFANWMSTNSAAVGLLVDKASIFPASKAGVTVPQMSATDTFFGDQKIFQVFKDAMNTVAPTWTWGPMTTQMNADVLDGYAPVAAGKGTIAAAQATAQTKMLADMKAKGLNAKAG
jgi:multiple sugar transport system substrate-binding protein